MIDVRRSRRSWSRVPSGVVVIGPRGDTRLHRHRAQGARATCRARLCHQR
jgi:hypothetical protein